MKITFLGSGHGVPEPNRNYSCALLEVGEKKYLMDIGFDPTHELIKRGLCPNDISAVFITHTHGDHLDGLVGFADICSWFYKDADPLFCLPRMEETVDALNGWLKITCNGLRDSLHFAQVTEGVFYDDGTIRVTAMLNGHTVQSFSYMIEAEGKQILFTGDMKGGDGPIADYARFADHDGIDLVIAECAHFDAMLYLEPLRKHPPKQLVINHYNWSFVEGCYHLKNCFSGEIPTVLATDSLEIRL